LIDLFKSRGITAVLTSLTAGGNDPEDTQVGISSLVDTWILLRAVDSDGERRRALSILKSRGMSHSHSVRELRLTSDGVEVAGPAEHQDHRSSRFAAVRSRPS
jgi:circadian clock protein KaiC